MGGRGSDVHAEVETLLQIGFAADLVGRLRGGMLRPQGCQSYRDGGRHMF